ncbi:acetylcoenzyme A synthetase [Encephalitozoon intestinalis ATCC 50506]|uniref:acetate--CoA ligase n=1 Tax=Encephalitozoon intestinalis (strain ATCC 50506) TaxID=876142 RepID=E0S750_ENCIT|nr:acetylcoenzyme A synthetase [Encephalitozoon intestinalis ATCC 50506]ADM11478.1 acetylcoenzyme A synthetase [Encephalitozoon intestinalis ATCC 50506]UTX45190.1 acetylcoenzyme A synthetase [Encephalitozoon intestinalis]
MNKGEYEALYKRSIEDKESFWEEQAKAFLKWDKMFDKVYNNNFESSRWFEGGMLNACYNCVDRHAACNPDKVAIIYDRNDGESICYTFKEVLDEVIRISAVLKAEGLKKGDTVALYMAMSPYAVFSALACARLGLVHNAIFGGFSASSVALRLDDSNAKFLMVQDVVERHSSTINFLGNVREALKGRSIPVLVFNTLQDEKKILDELNGVEGKILIWSKVMKRENEFIPCVPVGAEDSLFYLYTSGSTGIPKGIVHTVGGYLVYAALTSKTCFDLRKEDVFACTADIGWITGHTYVIYGPLLNGVTTVVFGGTPFYPSYFRLFKMVEKHKITQLYTAPTVIRTLRKYFSTNPLDHGCDLSSLRILGSVGEPINKNAYLWFKENFNKCSIVDTYWQTESGGILIAPIPYVVDGKPECACLPFLGQEVVIAGKDSKEDHVIEAKPYELGRVLLRRSWPGIARGILGDLERFKRVYFFYKGFYFTGDEGYKDADGHVWIRGRADDVINVSGHRISTAEVESAACMDPYIAEAAAVAENDEITGQALCFFVVLKDKETPQDKVKASLKETLRNKVGKFVNPKDVYFCEGIPKTATGKIMRRVLKNILAGDSLGDMSTCTNVDVIEGLKDLVSPKAN